MIHELLWLLAAFFLAGLVQGLLGFGFVIASTLVLVARMDMATLVFINLTMSILTSLVAMLSVKNLKSMPPKLLAKLTISSIAGIVLGIWLMDYVNEMLLKQITLLMILLAALLSLRQSKSFFAHPWTGWAGGFLSGVLTPSTGINGPPVVLHLNALLQSKAQIRATMLAYLLLVMAFGLISLVLKPGFTKPDLQMLAIASVPTFVGYGAGVLIFKNLNNNVFQRLVTIFLIVTSIAALYNLFFTT